MKIKITVRELSDRSLWLDYCEVAGTNEWALNEGLMSYDEEVELTEEQARRLGILKDKENNW